MACGRSLRSDLRRDEERRPPRRLSGLSIDEHGVVFSGLPTTVDDPVCRLCGEARSGAPVLVRRLECGYPGGMHTVVSNTCISAVNPESVVGSEMW